MSELRAKLQLLKDAEQDKAEIDKDLRREFISRWYAALDTIRPVFLESAVAVFEDQGLSLKEAPGRRDIGLEWERRVGCLRYRYELRYHPDFEACKVTLLIDTPLGGRSVPVQVEKITTATVEAYVEDFVREVMERI